MPCVLSGRVLGKLALVDILSPVSLYKLPCTVLKNTDMGIYVSCIAVKR